MARDQMRSAVPLDETPMASANRNLLLQDTQTRRASEQHDDSWVDDVDLLAQVYAAVSDICPCRLPPLRTVLDRTGEVDGIYVQADASDRTAEPLARLSDKRPSRFGLVSARSFTDEHNPGVGAALAHDGFADARSPASPTGLDLPGKPSESDGFVCNAPDSCAGSFTRVHGAGCLDRRRDRQPGEGPNGALWPRRPATLPR
jgi:hypothetical protein